MTIAEIAERIAERRKVYQAAMRADVDRLTREHGERPVREALRLIERRNERDQQHDGWNARQHAFEVKLAIERVLRERRRRTSELFPDGELLPGSWR
jgi:hypothetical protein